MPALDISICQAHAVFETNIFGVIALTQAPAFLLISTASSLTRSYTGQQNFLGLPFLATTAPASPIIVQIGSTAGVMPFAFGSIYNASKLHFMLFRTHCASSSPPLGCVSSSLSQVPSAPTLPSLVVALPVFIHCRQIPFIRPLSIVIISVKHIAK